MITKGIVYKVKPAYVFNGVESHNRDVEIPITSTTYINPIRVDWGDGTVEDYSSGTYLLHTYDTDDDNAEYTIRITSASGKLPCLCFGEDTNAIGTHPKARLTITELLFCNASFHNNLSTNYGYAQAQLASCKNLTKLCSSYLRHAVCLTYVRSFFKGLPNLTFTLKRTLFQHTDNIIGAEMCFNGSPGIIGSIQSRFLEKFANCGRFDSFFSGCSGLTGSIPEDLLNKCSRAYLMYSFFAGCSSLTGSIPEDLFKYSTNVIGFSSLFYECSGLTGSIPEGLFKYNTEVTEFGQIFYGCTGLTGSIPADLFRYNTKVTDFYGCFWYCPNLTGIPADLFKHNTNATNVTWAFRDCGNLDGTAPALWDTTQYPNITSHTGCFNGCSKLSNYADIPADWK